MLSNNEIKTQLALAEICLLMAQFDTPAVEEALAYFHLQNQINM